MVISLLTLQRLICVAPPPTPNHHHTHSIASKAMTVRGMHGSETFDILEKNELEIFFYHPDLSKEEMSFGRGENCDVPFVGPAAKKHQYFQAYSKVHFKLIRVSTIHVCA